MERTTRGWLNGMLGVVIFSGSLPATRIAVMDFDPLFLTAARAVIAGLLALGLLAWGRARRPDRADLFPLAIVAIGCVVAFPLLTAIALRYISAAHSIVFIGALPLATAIFAVLRNGERPRPAFWVFALLGGTLVTGYAFAQGLAFAPLGDGLMLCAVIACGLGYAEGARLSRRLDGLQVIAWALVLSLPVMLPLAAWEMPRTWDGIGPPAWIGLAYVSLFSMLIGFVFWYRGLAQGGAAAVGQLQLLQPFLGLVLAAVLLHEQVTPFMLLVAAGVFTCVAGSRKFA